MDKNMENTWTTMEKSMEQPWKHHGKTRWFPARDYDLKPFHVSMDWFKGESTGKLHGF